VKSKTQLPFFVYGTLLPGQRNAYLWAEEAEWQVGAWLANGRLYDLGTFPILLEEGADTVRGVVFAIRPEQYDAVVTRLDFLEGYDPTQPNAGLYQRVSRAVMTDEGENGRLLHAWVYIGHPPATPHMTPIPSGDWLHHTNQNPDND
jgi:gamma-glutamylcyclotransferase (GGCT)/AIG2-like uncharacterized protein YtfP